jgi:hypothetical protein
MMHCLHCGDCCRRMSPISNPCPHIVEVDGLVFCGIYDGRPQQCRDHDFPASKCPIGWDVLEFDFPQQAHDRIDQGYMIIRAGLVSVPDWRRRCLEL